MEQVGEAHALGAIALKRGVLRVRCADCGVSIERPTDRRFSSLCPSCRRLHKQYGRTNLRVVRLGQALPPGPFTVVACPEADALIGRIIHRIQLAADLCLGLRTPGERLVCQRTGKVIEVVGQGVPIDREEATPSEAQRAVAVRVRDLSEVERRRAKAYQKRRIA